MADRDVLLLIEQIYGSDESRREGAIDGAVGSMERVNRQAYDRLQQITRNGHRPVAASKAAAVMPEGHEPLPLSEDTQITAMAQSTDEAAATPADADTGDTGASETTQIYEAPTQVGKAAEPTFVTPQDPFRRPRRPVPAQPVVVHSGQGADVVSTRYSTTQVIKRR